MATLDQAALAQLFLNARTHNAWQDKPVSDDQLRAIYDLMKMGPTSANCSPARLVFVKSKAEKEKLRPCLAPGNVDKTMAAPVCAIIAWDNEFYEQLPQLFPHTDARSWFAGNEKLIHDTGFRNSSLQGAYLMLAARALGLDCGPMSGFDADKVRAAFFAGENVTVNFLCNLGYGDPKGLFPRSPRLDFAAACRIV